MRIKILLFAYHCIEKINKLIKQIEFSSYKYYKIVYVSAGGFLEMFLYLMLSIL